MANRGRIQYDYDLLHHLVALPFAVFSPLVMMASIEVWTWVIGECPDLEVPLIMEINNAWNVTIRRNAGLFSGAMKYGLLNSTSMLITNVCLCSIVTQIHSFSRSNIVQPTRL